MNRTKKIYFLSAFVLIIGCYVLNLSYSLFVQTEEKQIVNETVPYLSYSLKIEESQEVSLLSNANDISVVANLSEIENTSKIVFLNTTETNEVKTTVNPNTSKIVTLIINNSGTADINYGIKLLNDSLISETQYVQLVDYENANIQGELSGSSVKKIKFYLYNNESSAIEIKFQLTANYKTLALNYEKDPNIITEPKYVIKYLADEIIASAQTAKENGDTTRTVYTEPSDLPTTPTTQSNGSTEKILSYRGSSTYYYRGNVVDNYVNFSGMCFRIVSINSNKEVKLVLAAQKACEDITSSDTTSAFIGSGTYGYTYEYEPFGEDMDDSIVWMLFEAYFWYYTDYSNGAMKSSFNTWITNKFTDSTLSMMKKINSTDYAEPLSKEDVQYAGISTTANYYSYLTKNATNTSKGFWTATKSQSNKYITKYGYTDEEVGMDEWTYYYSDTVYAVYGNKLESKGLYDKNGTSHGITSYYYRPCITLKAEVECKSGTGTQTDPYIIG